MGVIAGGTTEIEIADEEIAAVLSEAAVASDGPASERGLSSAWVEAIARVRATGEPHRSTHDAGDRLFDVWLAPLDRGRVAVYAREIHTAERLRWLLHGLRNPLYGIRSAVSVLLRRELPAELRQVLVNIENAAVQAQDQIRDIEEGR